MARRGRDTMCITKKIRSYTCYNLTETIKSCQTSKTHKCNDNGLTIVDIEEAEIRLIYRISGTLCDFLPVSIFGLYSCFGYPATLWAGSNSVGRDRECNLHLSQDRHMSSNKERRSSLKLTDSTRNGIQQDTTQVSDEDR